MPLSNDNQDYGKSDEKNKENKNATPENKLTTDDLKGKQQVDGDLDEETDKAAEQEK